MYYDFYSNLMAVIDCKINSSKFSVYIYSSNIITVKIKLSYLNEKNQTQKDLYLCSLCMHLFIYLSSNVTLV